MRKIDQMQLFKTGDYGEKGAYTQDDIDEVISMFYKLGQDAPIIINQLDAHGEETPQGENVPAIGWVKNLYTKRDGVLYGDTVFLDEFYEIIKKGMYDYRSVYIPKNEEGYRYLRHVAMLGKAWPAVKGLDRVGLKAFNDKKGIRTINAGQSDGQEIIFSLNGEKINEIKNISQSDDESKLKETIMDKDVMFTESDLKLKIIDAVKEKAESLTASFAEKEAKFAEKIKGLEKTIETQNAELKTAREQLSEFSKKELERKSADLKRDVDSWKGVLPADKDRVFNLLSTLATIDSPQAQAQYAESYKHYSSLKSPITNTGGSRGDSDGDELPDTIAIPSHEEAMRMKSGGTR